MHNILTKLLVASMLLVAACKKGSSCEQIYDHTLSLLPDNMKKDVDGTKDQAIAKCEKMSPEARKCAADASSLEDLMKCPHE